MKHADISTAKKPDLPASLTAMQRAAAMARKIAMQTGTSIVLAQDGKPVRISAAQLRDQGLADDPS